MNGPTEQFDQIEKMELEVDTVITEVEIIARLMIAAGLGLIIGYERERQNQAAGLRTHMVLVTGSALE